MIVIRIIKLCSLILRLFKRERPDLVKNLGELHGLPQKMGQHISLYALDRSSEFALLYTSGTEEKIPLQDYLNTAKLAYREIIPVAQASVGQVFKVTTDKGLLAVKVKYANIETGIKQDFKLLSIIAAITKLLPLCNNPVPKIIQALRESVLAECDYRKEADTQNLFSKCFGNNPNIHVPHVHLEYSDERMIASQWVEGQFIHEYLEGAGETAREAAFKLLFDFELTALLKYGMVHADPHPGNFLFTQNEEDIKLTVLDYGNVVRLSDREVASMKRLLNGEYEDVAQLKHDLGILAFDSGILTYYGCTLGDILGIVFEPFYTADRYDFARWRLQYKLNTLLASREWSFPLILPPKILHIIRMFQGLYFYARKYDIFFNWHHGLREIANISRES